MDCTETHRGKVMDKRGEEWLRLRKEFPAIEKKPKETYVVSPDHYRSKFEGMVKAKEKK